MILYYDDTNGKIYYAIYEKDVFAFEHTTNITLSEFEVDEVDPTNKSLCIDLHRLGSSLLHVDSNGDGKYYIDTGELYERDGWEEYLEDII